MFSYSNGKIQPENSLDCMVLIVVVLAGAWQAADDYADRFPELLPEANVVDVIRARLVCSSGTQMKTFLEKIAKGFGLGKVCLRNQTQAAFNERAKAKLLEH